MTADDGRDHRGDGVGVADVAAVELVRKALDGATGTGHHRGALLGEHRADTGADTAHPTGHQNGSADKAEADGGACHCASVPSKCLLRFR